MASVLYAADGDRSVSGPASRATAPLDSGLKIAGMTEWAFQDLSAIDVVRVRFQGHHDLRAREMVGEEFSISSRIPSRVLPESQSYPKTLAICEGSAW